MFKQVSSETYVLDVNSSDLATRPAEALIAKPAHVFGRDREWAALVSFATDPDDRATLAVVGGLRRQGKTYLLHALTDALGGLYFEAAPATERESLRLFGAAIGRRIGAGVQLDFETWQDGVDYLFSLASNRSGLVVIDEFPQLAKTSPRLLALLRRELAASAQTRRGRTRLILCGAATPVMHRLLDRTGALAGQTDLDLLVRPLDYRDAARFWNLSDPRLAVLVHAVVGGTPAYRRQFVRDDVPLDLDDFDGWVVRTALNPATPLMREARYLLADELDVRELALYHSVLAAVTEGHTTWSSIATYVGRRPTDIARPISVLEGCGLLARDPDLFRSGRSRYRVTEPLIGFYQAIMRPTWSRLEHGHGARVWYESGLRFSALVVQPHFATLCRRFAATAPGKLFGDLPDGPVVVGTGLVADPSRRAQLRIDVAMLAPTEPGQPRRVLSLGEARWDEVMSLAHLARLQRARDLLRSRGYQTDDTVLACYSAAGFDSELRATADRDRVLLIGLDELYS
ncbi:MAG: hypothetical protein L0Y54_07320 [Sporichthyaceae bacterium]|nr:hypothetical protein [Sporichthyaceae bacterium]